MLIRAHTLWGALLISMVALSQRSTAQPQLWQSVTGADKLSTLSCLVLSRAMFT